MPVYRHYHTIISHYKYRLVSKLNGSFSNQRKFLPKDYWPTPVLVNLSSLQYFSCKVPEEVHFWGVPETPVSLITDGDWDLQIDECSLEPPGPMPGFRTMYEMFVDQLPIECTTQYKDICNILRDNDGIYSHEGQEVRTKAGAVEYLSRYRLLFDEIQNNGYKSQEELGNYPVRYEINVCIGRGGQITYLAHGTHRLAIAKILGLKSIPVIIRTVHRTWAEYCFDKYGTDLFRAICCGISELKSFDCDSSNANNS